MFHRKRRGWIEETVTASGDSHGLRVTIHDMPCLRDPATGRRGYAYGDFGVQFREGIDAAIGHEPYGGLTRGGASEAMTSLEAGGVIRGKALRGRDPIDIEISGWPANARKVSFNPRRQFDPDLSDEIIAAFEAVQLKP